MRHYSECAAFAITMFVSSSAFGEETPESLLKQARKCVAKLAGKISALFLFVEVLKKLPNLNPCLCYFAQCLDKITRRAGV